jgi:Rad3-related DNA helicase
VFKQLVMTDAEKLRSVILTSGTLSPMRIIYTELRTLFRVKLVNEHFIENERVFATILSSDFTGNKFKFNFENRDMKKSFRDLGRLLYKLQRNIQGGILIFFTSYTHI